MQPTLTVIRKVSRRSRSYLIIKRKASTHHLVHDHAEPPPVHCSPVIVILQHLSTKRSLSRLRYTPSHIILQYVSNNQFKHLQYRINLLSVFSCATLFPVNAFTFHYIYIYGIRQILLSRALILCFKHARTKGS